MTGLRQLLDEEVGSPPPSTVDLDAIIGAERRRLRYRQAGLGVSAGLVALAAVLVASTLTDWGERSAPAGGRSTTPHSAPAPRDQTAVASRPATAHAAANAATRAAEADRLTSVLSARLQKALPGARFVTSPVIPAQLVISTDPLKFVDVGSYFVAAAEITDAAGVGNITVTVGQPDDVLRTEHDCTHDPAPKDLHVTCTMKHPGGGALLQILRTSHGKYQRDVVEILRPDGNVVSIELMNTVHPVKAERDGLNLTVAQLETLATDPQLATKL